MFNGTTGAVAPGGAGFRACAHRRWRRLYSTWSDLTLAHWLLAAAIASSTLLLERARPLLLIISAGLSRETSK